MSFLQEFKKGAEAARRESELGKHRTLKQEMSEPGPPKVVTRPAVGEPFPEKAPAAAPAIHTEQITTTHVEKLPATTIQHENIPITQGKVLSKEEYESARASYGLEPQRTIEPVREQGLPGEELKYPAESRLEQMRLEKEQPKEVHTGERLTGEQVVGKEYHEERYEEKPILIKEQERPVLGHEAEGVAAVHEGTHADKYRTGVLHRPTTEEVKTSFTAAHGQVPVGETLELAKADLQRVKATAGHEREHLGHREELKPERHEEVPVKREVHERVEERRFEPSGFEKERAFGEPVRHGELGHKMEGLTITGGRREGAEDIPAKTEQYIKPVEGQLTQQSVGRVEELPLMAKETHVLTGDEHVKLAPTHGATHAVLQPAEKVPQKVLQEEELHVKKEQPHISPEYVQPNPIISTGGHLEEVGPSGTRLVGQPLEIGPGAAGIKKGATTEGHLKGAYAEKFTEGH